MEHNPVLVGISKYVKFTQIAPTISFACIQFWTNPKSPKFLKLNFDVFDDFFAENLIEKKTLYLGW